MDDIGTLFKTKKNKYAEILAVSKGNLQIELSKELNNDDKKNIIDFLNDNKSEISPNSLFLINNIKKYFIYPETLSFLARLNKNPIAFIVGIEIEKSNDNELLQKEVNWGKGNTVYIFSHEINFKYSQRKYEKILIKIALNWLSKKGYEYICGYEKEGKAEEIFPGCIIIDRIKNWNGTGKIYEYFKLSL